MDKGLVRQIRSMGDNMKPELEHGIIIREGVHLHAYRFCVVPVELHVVEEHYAPEGWGTEMIRDAEELDGLVVLTMLGVFKRECLRSSSKGRQLSQ